MRAGRTLRPMRFERLAALVVVAEQRDPVDRARPPRRSPHSTTDSRRRDAASPIAWTARRRGAGTSKRDPRRRAAEARASRCRASAKRRSMSSWFADQARRRRSRSRHARRTAASAVRTAPRAPPRAKRASASVACDATTHTASACSWCSAWHGPKTGFAARSCRYATCRLGNRRRASTSGTSCAAAACGPTTKPAKCMWSAVVTSSRPLASVIATPSNARDSCTRSTRAGRKSPLP